MDWFRHYNGATCDAKWLTIGRLVGCPPGIVSNVFAALMEHANQQRPRGSVEGWDVETYVEFSGFDADVVDRVFEQLHVRRLIVDGRLRAWDKRNANKTDKTAAERKRNERERKRAAAAGGEVTTSHGVTGAAGTSHATSRHVTPQDRQSEALAIVGNASSSDSSCSVGNSQSKSKADARALNEQEVLQKLEAANASGGFVHRWKHASDVQRWVRNGVTEAHIEAAIALGIAKRKKAQSTQPLNIGFLDAILGDVMGQAAPHPTAGSSPAVRDTAETEFRNAVEAWNGFVQRGGCTREQADDEIAKARAKLEAKRAGAIA